VGMEATGYAQWFEGMLAQLGHELWVGDAAEIRAAMVRKQKTDVRDAQHILDLLLTNRFPRIWIPSPAERDVRQLLQEVDGILALSESATARLRAIMERVYSGMLGSYFQMLTAVYQDPEFRARMAENHTVMHATFSDVAQRIRAVLEEGKAAGEFDPAIPTSVMLRFFFALLSPRTVFGGRVSHRASGLVVVQEDISAEDVVEYLSRCFFRGIAPDRPTRQQ